MIDFRSNLIAGAIASGSDAVGASEAAIDAIGKRSSAPDDAYSDQATCAISLAATCSANSE